MAARDIRKLVFDIQEAAGSISSFVHGKSFQDYEDDKMLQSAVERQFEIVGEALRQAILIDQTLEVKITAARRIIDFRNRLAHGYSEISTALVWGIVERNLPLLLQEVRELIEKA